MPFIELEITQMLADPGADVIKVERPGVGDDPRHWGPPFLQDGKRQDTDQATCFTACNRNKRSLTHAWHRQARGAGAVPATHSTADWIALLHDKAVPRGAINDIGQAFADSQVKTP